jgi:anti-sigma factor RsiW
MNRHWTDDDFIAKVYGLGPKDDHLAECAACRESLARFQARRAAVLAFEERDVPGEVLASQRLAIIERVADRHRPVVKRVIPVLAAAGAVALGLFLTVPPSNHKPRVDTSISDAQLFQETAAIGQSAEPRGATPIEALFQE